MKQILFFFCLLAAGCCKDKPPVKKCYTVINVKIVQHPNTYEVTYARPRDTFKVITHSIYPVGYNTCTGYNWNNNFRPLIP